jgi:hypothetical protein
MFRGLVQIVCVSPMPSLADGRPDIIVAVGGGVYCGEYIAFTLPRNGVR